MRALTGVATRLLVGLAGLILLLTPGSVRAGDSDNAARLAEVLRIGEVIAVLRDEGLVFGANLDRDMLDGQGGAFWATQVARAYDSDQMAAIVRGALASRMDERKIAASLAFFESPLGQRVLSLETSARLVMSDPDLEQVARDTYASLKGGDDARLAAIARLIRVNDLVERNVTGTLNASFQFMLGLVDGGASAMSEAEITAEIWIQEDETRRDTEGWLHGFMLMAYNPLSDDELEAYFVFSGSPAGQALNAALFDGYDIMYLSISYRLGILVAEATASSDL